MPAGKETLKVDLEGIEKGHPEFQYTSEQLGVTREFKKMLGDVLDVIEAVIPVGLQQDKTKRLIQNKMYDGLKAILGELK